MGQQHVTQRAHEPQLCKSWAISAERGGGNKCWVQLQTDCVCPVGCIFRPEQMLVYHVCCDVTASLFVSWVDPRSPSNVKGSQVKSEWGGETRVGFGEKEDGYQGLKKDRRQKEARTIRRDGFFLFLCTRDTGLKLERDMGKRDKSAKRGTKI